MIPRVTALILAVAVTLVTALPVLAGEPPVPEPPTWDKSSLSVAGTCIEGVPTFTVTNNGADMSGPAPWYRLAVAGGAADCAADVAAGYIETGEVTLAAGASALVTFVPFTPPTRLCVQQRPGHPGTGWASATITAEDAKACTTAEDVADEPGRVRWLYLPALAQ